MKFRDEEAAIEAVRSRLKMRGWAVNESPVVVAGTRSEWLVTVADRRRVLRSLAPGRLEAWESAAAQASVASSAAAEVTAGAMAGLVYGNGGSKKSTFGDFFRRFRRGIPTLKVP